MRQSVDAVLHYKVNPGASRPTDGRPAGLQGPLSCGNTGGVGLSGWTVEKGLTLGLVAQEGKLGEKKEKKKKRNG